MRTKEVVSTKQVVATAIADGVLVLVPWKHPLVNDIEDCLDAMHKCSKCGLKCTLNLLGYGSDGSVCFDCHKEANDVIERLRKLRAA